MSEQSRELGRSRLQRDGAERYERYQRTIRSGKAAVSGGARPQEFDAHGFPIPQGNPSFLERVARLLNPR